MKLRASCVLKYNFEQATPALFMLKAVPGAAQHIIEQEFTITPAVPVQTHIDCYGNEGQRVLLSAGPCEVKNVIVADTSDVIDVAAGAPPTPMLELPADTLIYMLPSRYCHPQLMLEEARQVTQDYSPGYDQAAAICDHIHQQFIYEYGSSNITTTALDTWNAKKGVCRDFAHLGITLSRALDLPARMVVGFLYELDPMDLHAWYEVFIDGRWYTFDATQSTPKGGRIVLGYGRDATDVAFATFFGAFDLVDMRISVECCDDASL